MDTGKTISYETVLRTVREWPVEQRLDLLQALLSTLATEVKPAQPRERTLEKALGLLATGQPTPSNTEIQKWFHERRMNRYG
jgi:dihydroneopterin aldolase